MPVIYTDELEPGKVYPTQRQIYNGLDSMITFEVHDALQSLFNQEPEIYVFERALQGPVLEMMLRGFRIDEYERRKGVAMLRTRLDKLGRILTSYAYAVWNKPLNPRSPKQLIDFFYGTMKLPEQWTSKKGERKLSTDRDTLEKLEVYFHAMPIIAVILAIRETAKQLEVFETEIDADGRFRTSYNIGGTETWRFSSSASSEGTGRNIQNIEPILRKMFVADPGKKLCGIDLEQAESREVGWLCGTLFDDWSYLDACYSGDLHTLTCKMIWPKLPWTNDKEADRAIADQIFYRQFSYRDMAKRGGHGCLTAEHEVLTRTGWVPISSKPNEILIWSKTGSKFAGVSNWIDQDYTGDIVAVRGNSISLDATADHRILYFKDATSRVLHEMSAEAIGHTGFIPLGQGYLGGTAEISIEVAKLIAAFQCDGHQKSINRVHFHMHKLRKKERLFKLCVAAGIEFTITDSDNITIKATGWPKKAGAYLLNWPVAALDAYLAEHLHWDGHKSTTAQCLFSVDRMHLEWLQTLGRIRGIGGAIQKPNISGFGSTVYKLQQNKRQFATIASLRTSTKHQSCRVYCPTVASGAFYVRHNGKISVTGNSNYYGTPWTMARHLKVPAKFMEDFQSGYFSAFPGIPRWHRWVAQQIQTTQSITTPWGNTRHFFGRPNDDTTLREAIAFSPQCSTALRMNLGMYRVWEQFPEAQLLAQVHDAIYFQYDPKHEAELIPAVLKTIDIRMSHGSRELIVPGEAKVGWNWASHSPTNPNGLMKFKTLDTRTEAPRTL